MHMNGQSLLCMHPKSKARQNVFGIDWWSFEKQEARKLRIDDAVLRGNKDCRREIFSRGIKISVVWVGDHQLAKVERVLPCHDDRPMIKRTSGIGSKAWSRVQTTHRTRQQAVIVCFIAPSRTRQTGSEGRSFTLLARATIVIWGSGTAYSTEAECKR